MAAQTDPAPPRFRDDESTGSTSVVDQVAGAVSRKMVGWIAGIVASGIVAFVGAGVAFYSRVEADSARAQERAITVNEKLGIHDAAIRSLSSDAVDLDRRVTDVAATQRGIAARLDRQTAQLDAILERLPARRR